MSFPNGGNCSYQFRYTRAERNQSCRDNTLRNTDLYGGNFYRRNQYLRREHDHRNSYSQPYKQQPQRFLIFFCRILLALFHRFFCPTERYIHITRKQHDKNPTHPLIDFSLPARRKEWKRNKRQQQRCRKLNGTLPMDEPFVYRHRTKHRGKPDNESRIRNN